MSHVTRHIGYWVLMGFYGLLAYYTLLGAYEVLPLLVIPMLGIFVSGGLASIYVLKREVLGGQMTVLFSKTQQLNALGAFMGAWSTYLLNVYIGLGAVLASCFIGIIAALYFKKVQVPVYCGAFLGMSSMVLLPLQAFAVASILVAIVFLLTKDVFNGYGGKLGTIAFSAALITAWLFSYSAPGIQINTMLEALLVIIFAMIGAGLTFAMNHRLNAGPVLSSAVVGFFLGAILLFFPHVFGEVLALVVVGASYVGMCGANRFSDERGIIVAGLFFGLIYIFSAPYLGGAGGKLGTTAFISGLSVKGLFTLSVQLQHRLVSQKHRRV